MNVAREARNEVHVLKRDLEAETLLRMQKDTEFLGRPERGLQESPLPGAAGRVHRGNWVVTYRSSAPLRCTGLEAREVSR